MATLLSTAGQHQTCTSHPQPSHAQAHTCCSHDVPVDANPQPFSLGRGYANFSAKSHSFRAPSDFLDPKPLVQTKLSARGYADFPPHAQTLPLCSRESSGVLNSNAEGHAIILSGSQNPEIFFSTTSAEPVFSKQNGPVADNLNQTHKSVHFDPNVLIIPPHNRKYSNNGGSEAKNKPLLTAVSRDIFFPFEREPMSNFPLEAKNKPPSAPVIQQNVFPLERESKQDKHELAPAKSSVTPPLVPGPNSVLFADWTKSGGWTPLLFAGQPRVYPSKEFSELEFHDLSTAQQKEFQQQVLNFNLCLLQASEPIVNEVSEPSENEAEPHSRKRFNPDRKRFRERRASKKPFGKKTLRKKRRIAFSQTQTYSSPFESIPIPLLFDDDPYDAAVEEEDKLEEDKVLTQSPSDLAFFTENLSDSELYAFHIYGEWTTEFGESQHAILMADMRVGSETIPVCFDTGSARSFCSSTFLKESKKVYKVSHLASPAPIRAANGEVVSPSGQITVAVRVGNTVKQQVQILDNLPVKLLLGCDFLRKNKGCINFATKRLSFPGTQVATKISNMVYGPTKSETFLLYATSDFVIPPQTCVGGVPVIADTPQRSQARREGLISSAVEIGEPLAVDFGVNALLQHGQIGISLKDLSTEPQIVRKGDSLASFKDQPFSAYEVLPADKTMPPGLQDRIDVLRNEKTPSHPEVTPVVLFLSVPTYADLKTSTSTTSSEGKESEGEAPKSAPKSATTAQSNQKLPHDSKRSCCTRDWFGEFAC
jgi:hypothetical protein